MQIGPEFKLVQLANGTFSVYSVAHAETFHPVIGPVAEAEALYVKQLRLHDRLQAHPDEFVIWDVGLGAAANVLTVLRAARPYRCKLRFLSFDRSTAPLQFALEHAEELGYFDGFESLVRAVVAHPAAPVHVHLGEQQVSWELHLGDFPTLLHDPGADSWAKPHAILFDAYSPARNPEMWTQPLFSRVFALLNPDRPCSLPTYSRSTLLRVTLLRAGFFVGRGHATGEKEETTVAANRLDLLEDPLDRGWLKRARSSSSAEPLWEPVYRQAPLSLETWERLRQHPQFA